MAKRLTFIHAADLHLGAPFRGLRALSDAWANRLLSAIGEAYDRVIDAALAREVDFVVIAGDIFDSARPSYGDYQHFFRGLERLEAAGIPAYLVTGNHDPYTSWQHDFFSLPPNARMLPGNRPGFALYERDGEPLCLVGGRGYYNQTWPADECIAEGVTRAAAVSALTQDHPHADEAPFGVGVLHTGLNLDPVKAPVDPAVLLRAGMDYWALGHIHMKYAYPSMEDPQLVFSGCIQGRDIKETGERGALLVTLAEGEPNEVEFIPTASVVWQRMRVDVSDCGNLPDVSDKIMRELFRVNGKAQCEEMVVRIALEGATPLHPLLERPDVVFELRRHVNDSYSEFFCDALVDATVMPRDKEALRAEGLFPAVLLQVAEAQRGDADEQVGFLQDEFLTRGVPLPSGCSRIVGQLAEEAENLVLDLLSQGDDR
ncbi:metallophosphoesterase family protein [Arabiibacter massiliensis]|uniref:metallophosphoesterase family protein n=1 Tax=Arabiibacter massiliensis TaxID=1870985 RepID=UPI0009BA330C|nr:exonuclease SbcCD subunit D [Arabiibacter massiliensis]